jgi:predicted house-cleaning noncanonical NTP pyrophosphatase (MazG superfamily)
MQVSYMFREKLVRDKIPEFIRNSGEEPSIRIVHGEELDTLLRRKIVEESGELLESGEIEEIIDIYEALDALLALRSIDLGLLEIMKQAKRLSRGGFDRGIVLSTDKD